MVCRVEEDRRQSGLERRARLTWRHNRAAFSVGAEAKTQLTGEVQQNGKAWIDGVDSFGMEDCVD